jgi:hypothetical protein
LRANEIGYVSGLLKLPGTHCAREVCRYVGGLLASPRKAMPQDLEFAVFVLNGWKERDMRNLGVSTNLQRANVSRTGSNRFTFCIPVAEYQALISLCDQSTPEYNKFKSGIIVDQAVHFLFDESTARSLYQYALAKCPAAARHIQQTMREAGDEFPF